MVPFNSILIAIVIGSACGNIAHGDRSLRKHPSVSSTFLHGSRISREAMAEDLEESSISFFQKSSAEKHPMHNVSLNADTEQATLKSNSRTFGLNMLQVYIPHVSESLHGVSDLAESVVGHLDFFHGRNVKKPRFIQRTIPSSEIRPVDENWAQEGGDIWNETYSWVNFTFWHPRGVISNVYKGKVIWANVGFLSLTHLCGLSLMAYPVIPVVMIYLCVIIVSISISLDEDNVPFEFEEGSFSMKSMSQRLTPFSQGVYKAWCILCCSVPSLLVFGMPLMLVSYSYSYPQEVFMVTLVICMGFAFNHGLYMVFFVPFVLGRVRKESQWALGSGPTNGDKRDVYHWVFFPNYMEDYDILSESVRSVAQSTMAQTRIGIVLAMEEREQGAMEKATRLREEYSERFRDIQITIHPKDLPNDPPGKASNMAHAFEFLVQYLKDTNQETSDVMLTIADADTEFHECYFDALARKFQEAEDPENTIWQSLVYHLKNYHRQPGPCVVGSLITAMTETACLADPNAVRYPYSTYSLPLSLVSKVGGWDPEWIAEDWHMGIKCFLLTMGRSQVKPILLPTLNYSPEESTWSGTVGARWAQAKRHALGFSDLSYFFMMLPLLFVHLVNVSKSPGLGLQGFWRLVYVGVSQTIRLVNTHALVGIMTMYGILDLGLKKVMVLALGETRGVNELFDRTLFGAKVFALASSIMTLVVTVNFQGLHRDLVNRLDPPAKSWTWLYKYRVPHWICTVLCFACNGLFVFPAMACTVWIAAFKCGFMWQTGGFDYEVAAKPTKRNHL